MCACDHSKEAMKSLKCYQYVYNTVTYYTVIDQAGRPWDMLDYCTFVLMSTVKRNHPWYSKSERGILRRIQRNADNLRYQTLTAQEIERTRLMYNSIQKNAWRFVDPIGQQEDSLGRTVIRISNPWIDAPSLIQQRE